MRFPYTGVTIARRTSEGKRGGGGGHLRQRTDLRGAALGRFLFSPMALTGALWSFALRVRYLGTVKEGGGTSRFMPSARWAWLPAGRHVPCKLRLARARTCPTTRPFVGLSISSRKTKHDTKGYFNLFFFVLLIPLGLGDYQCLYLLFRFRARGDRVFFSPFRSGGLFAEVDASA